MIPVEHEDDEMVASFPDLIENCYFCKTPTRWWHKNSNTPVCKWCANEHSVKELPDH